MAPQAASRLSSLRFVWSQTPHILDFAESAKHLFVLFGDGCSFRHAEKLDHESMVAGNYDKRINPSDLPRADVFVGDPGGVVPRISDLFVVPCLAEQASGLDFPGR
jgi:hypothetical protein